MSTKKCSKCGWVYPKEWPGRTCKFCHGSIIGGTCNVCGRYFDYLTSTRRVCTECATIQHSAWRTKRKQHSDDQLKEWLDRIAKVPTPYRTLTNDEWLEACKHFGGCAYCGKESIDARAMFIPFKRGGRYCAWNVVPMCERCAKIHMTIANPFRTMDDALYSHSTNTAKKYNFDSNKLQGIVDYLGKKLEEIT